MNYKSTSSLLSLLTLLVLALMPLNALAAPDQAAQIDAASRAALNSLYRTNPKGREFGSQAVAVLVFPSITKGGFVVAGQRGKGALLTHGGTIGYYQSTAASYGLQAGIQRYGYALFFMTPQALKHLHREGGWELGSSPSLVVLNKGTAGSLNTTQLKGNIYGVFFNQQGLMGGLGFQGTKITEIHPS
jgi:lipid-binding SYLF domain-containing protein